jgi:phosphoglycolate phosphatase
MMGAVLIDLDGTLVDSAPDIVEAVNRMLRALDAPALSPATVTGFIGNGVPTLVQRVLAASAIAPGQHARALDQFQRHYAETNGRYSRVFPGVLTGLARLREAGYRIACVTNKPQAASETLLSVSGLAPLLDAVVGGDATPHMKPHAEPLLHACRLLGADPACSVMVGDSGVDVAAARAAGMPVYIVSYGYPGMDHAGMAGATFIDSLDHIPLQGEHHVLRLATPVA